MCGEQRLDFIESIIKFSVFSSSEGMAGIWEEVHVQQLGFNHIFWGHPVHISELDELVLYWYV